MDRFTIKKHKLDDDNESSVAGTSSIVFIYFLFISIYILLIHIRSTNLLDIEPVIM
jgi:hypothetical protein